MRRFMSSFEQPQIKTRYFSVIDDKGFYIPDSDQLLEAAHLIKAGSLVVFPTETVYGLGADAGQEKAVEAVFAAKGRPQDNPLIIHAADAQSAFSFCPQMNALSQSLARLYWPGPLTLIVPRGKNVSLKACAGLDTMGLRVPSDPVAQDFLRACACPVAAPSANRSGRPSPTNGRMAKEEMDGRVAGIILGKSCSIGLESAILYAKDDQNLFLLRAGQLDPAGILRDLHREGHEDLQLFYQNRLLFTLEAGEVRKPEVLQNPQDLKDLPKAPGTRYRHYSPQCMVELYKSRTELEKRLTELHQGRILILDLKEHLTGLALEADRFICKNYEDLASYGEDLYQAFFEADRQGCDLVLAWLPETEGAWTTALKDRLSRAAGLS